MVGGMRQTLCKKISEPFCVQQQMPQHSIAPAATGIDWSANHTSLCDGRAMRNTYYSGPALYQYLSGAYKHRASKYQAEFSTGRDANRVPDSILCVVFLWLRCPLMVQLKG